MNYFTNTTPSQRRIMASYFAWSQSEGRTFKNDKECKGAIQEYCGDTAVKTIAESERTLTVISVDSGIQVITRIDKESFETSESLEIDGFKV